MTEIHTIWTGKGYSLAGAGSTYGRGVLLTVHLMVNNRRHTLHIFKPLTPLGLDVSRVTE